MIVAGLWLAAHAFGIPSDLRGHFGGPFLAVALMFGVLWAFGWGAGEPLTRWISPEPPLGSASRAVRPLTTVSIARVLAPGAFAAGIYLLIAVPLHELSAWSLLLYFGFPSLLAGALEYVPPGPKLGWQDVMVLGALGCAVEYGWLEPGLRHPGLGNIPKFLLADVALYLYIVQRRLPGMGFDLRLRLRDLRIGAREWALFAPIGIALGLLLGFLRFHARLPAAGTFAGTVLVTFIFVALPEELFFRCLLQNLLETRLPRRLALALAAAIFGLSHYIHGAVFNWRYVILAAIAGWFYGRAWRSERRVGASAVSHTMVDTVWVTWFLAQG
ncbi:MAG: CPBP family intramembrane metalloprotease [Gammaproteobacteria bacterium]|nr:CPBP family intramembrane metalloprotease [Gammaproteobacteria bacterium]